MYNAELLPKSEIKFSFELSWDETKPYRDEAVRELSQARPIPGFRPGHASYEDAKRHFGEMKILETALERIVRAEYVKAVLGEKAETVGSPQVSVDALTPGQPVKFSTLTPIAPQATTLPELKNCSVLKGSKPVQDAQVEEAIDEMRRMRRTEARVERAATMEDLVIVDMEMMRGGVILEGGKGSDYRVYLNESHYVPGLTQKLEGIKAGEERVFTLPFPEEHFQKHLAGKDVDFKVKATGVFELAMPKVDDEFAKGVGLESIEKLREVLKSNLQIESDKKSSDAAEIEMLEKLTDNASFTEIPELLINEEVRRMMHEIQHGVEEQGMKWEDYLSSIKKTADDLRLDFVKQAIRRIQTAVLIKAFAKQQKIEVSEEEIHAEIDRILEQVPADDTETRERLASPDYHEYVAITMRNRQVLEWLKKECIK